MAVSLKYYHLDAWGFTIYQIGFDVFHRFFLAGDRLQALMLVEIQVYLYSNVRCKIIQARFGGHQ